MKKTLLLSLIFLFSLTVFCQNTDSLAVARQVDSLIQVSRALISKRDFDKALDVNIVAEKLALEKFGIESASYGSACFNHGRVLYFSGDFPEAEKWYLESKAIREKVLGKEHLDYAANLNSLGNLYQRMGRYEKSEPLYLESKTIYEKVFGIEHREYAMSLNNLAILYKNMGNYEKAEPLYFESKTIREKTIGKEHPDYAWSLHNLANLYYEMGDYEKAEPFYFESKTIREKILDKGDPDYARSLNSLAILYYSMGNHEKAEPFFIDVLDIWEKAMGKEHPDYATILHNLATLYWDMGNYEKAESLYLESKTIYNKTVGTEHPDYASSLNNLASLYTDMGNYEKAEALHLESKSIREKALGKEHPDYAESLENLANLYTEMSNYKNADSLYKESKIIREKVLGKEHPDYEQSLYNLAILYWTVKKFDIAAPLLYEAINLKKSLLLKASHHLSERELALYVNKFATEESQVYSFTQMNADNPSFCYDNTLFHKGFLLNTVSQISKLATGDSATAENYYRFKSYYRRLAKEYSTPLAERDSATVVELEQIANALEKELTRTVAGFGEALRQVNWQEVQTALRADEAAVEFVRYEFYNPKQTDSVMYAALVLRPGWPSPAWITLGEEKQLQSLFSTKGNTPGNNVNQLYATRGIEPDSTQRSLEGLYPFIWRPLDSLLHGVATVYFSPSGLLHYVNHGAIPVDSVHNLGDRYHLVQLGSTRQLVVGSSGSSANRSATAALFGGIRYDMDSIAIPQNNTRLPKSEAVASRGSLNFQYTDATLRGGDWQYLPGTEQEINELEKMMRKTGATVSIRNGYAATEEAFKRIGQATPSPHILHIATHGFFFPDPKDNLQSAIRNPQLDQPVFKISDHPMIRSGLLLAGANHAWKTGKPLHPDMEDGILTAYEISQMNLSNTELVVLSACETGLGQIQGNEGVYGLQRAFKIAGAKYLIMSLWQVPDQQTSLLMTTFYKNWLEEKMEIPEAFRAAQKDMRERGFDPYQWAGFILVG